MSLRKTLLIGAVVAGLSLLIIAYTSASTIPDDAQNDFNALVNAASGHTLSYSVGFDNAYKQMSADRRILQQSLLGCTGAVLLAAGLLGLVIPVPGALVTHTEPAGSHN